MNLKTPSQLYLEGHAGNYMACKVKADSNVNLALQSQLARESQWVNKSSTIVQCQDIFEKVEENIMIPTAENCANLEVTISKQMPRLKEAVNIEVKQHYLEKWNEKTKELIMQGDFLNLLINEQSNVTWQSTIYGVPRGGHEFCNESCYQHISNTR